MATLSDLRGLTQETIRVGSLDVTVRGLTAAEYAEFESRFPDEWKQFETGKGKPPLNLVSAIVAKGLSTNGEDVAPEDVDGLAAGIVMKLFQAVMVVTNPDARPLVEALQRDVLERAAGQVQSAKRSRNSSKS